MCSKDMLFHLYELLEVKAIDALRFFQKSENSISPESKEEFRLKAIDSIHAVRKLKKAIREEERH